MGLLHKTQRIGEYTVVRRLGEGQFAEVWEVKAGDGARYALKIEKRKDWASVKAECKVLKRIANQCTQVASVKESGTHEDHFYMVMQLLGHNLADARRASPGSRLSPRVAAAVGMSTLTALREVHDAGVIHRDIKPANFAVSPPGVPPDSGTWVLVDFGLARRYLSPDAGGGHAPERADASFRGSTNYASVNAHAARDLSRRDDLWSWLYMVIELVTGSLPWRVHGGVDGDDDRKAAVAERKTAALGDPRLYLAAPDGPLPDSTVALPEPLLSIHAHLAALGFADAPDYGLIANCLGDLAALGDGDAIPSLPGADFVSPPGGWPGEPGVAPRSGGDDAATTSTLGGISAPSPGWLGTTPNDRGVLDTPASPPPRAALPLASWSTQQADLQGAAMARAADQQQQQQQQQQDRGNAEAAPKAAKAIAAAAGGEAAKRSRDEAPEDAAQPPRGSGAARDGGGRGDKRTRANGDGRDRGDRGGSPDPRDDDHRRRERGREDRDRGRDYERERDRDRGGRDYDRDRGRDRERERDRDRDRGGRDYERDRDRGRDRERSRERDRSRERERSRDRERDKPRGGGDRDGGDRDKDRGRRDRGGGGRSAAAGVDGSKASSDRDTPRHPLQRGGSGKRDASPAVAAANGVDAAAAAAAPSPPDLPLGRPEEVAELLRHHHSGRATEEARQAEAALAALPPLQAVAAVASLVDRLACQTGADAAPAVARMLRDLGAYAAEAAGRAARRAGW